jgi:hypothetical protein
MATMICQNVTAVMSALRKSEHYIRAPNLSRFGHSANFITATHRVGTNLNFWVRDKAEGFYGNHFDIFFSYGLDSPNPRTATSLLALAFGALTTFIEADYGRIDSSTIRVLSDARPSAEPQLCLVFNILVPAGVTGLCMSARGFAMDLSIIVLTVVPALMLLNIALFAQME